MHVRGLQLKRYLIGFKYFSAKQFLYFFDGVICRKTIPLLHGFLH
jgi:hypothetical protein